MDAIALRVAAKFSARPIPLDTGAIRKLTDELAGRVSAYASRLPQDMPLGHEDRFLEWKWTTKTLKGREIHIKGYFTAEMSRHDRPVLNAHVSQPHWMSDDLDVDVLLGITLNGSMSAASFTSTVSHALKADLYQALVHELTHVAEWEYVPKNDVDSPHEPSQKKDYYNSPHEIRAFLRQILEDILPKAAGSFKRIMKPRSNHDFVMKLLGTSTKWKQIQGYLTRQNEALILKAVYRALEEQGLLLES